MLVSQVARPLLLHSPEKSDMDRPIDATFARHRRRRRLLIAGVAAAAVSVAFGWGPSLLRPSLRRSAIRTAVVDEGPVDATISAEGTVLPEVERVLSSPTDARVLRILKRAGTSVKKGDAIVALDLSEQVLEGQRLDQGLALKQNEQNQKRLELEEKLVALKSQTEIKTLQLQALREQLARSRALHQSGLIAEETLRQAELAEAQAAVELRELQEQRDNAERSTRLQVEGLALEMATLRKERAQAAHQLDLATAKADRDGVVTWTVTDEGAAVHRGDVIARVADLSSYRVDATVSDVHALRLSTGLPVVVRVADATLMGTVANVVPTVQNGVISISVALQDKTSPLLRSHLRVDVYVIVDHRERTLRLRRGPFLNGSGPQNVFVVRGDRAVRTPVQIGIVGLDRCEVSHGLKQGDEVVVSDMSDYAYARTIGLR
jgi:HlyD family secretion protein